ncbi:MAG: ABC transporter ATP-binding protein [Bryobacter sp.]|nr:ABC transporter ATP-binding protein [Bryobacter sp.]
MDAITIRDLEFRYRKQAPLVLQVPSFSLAQGEHCFLYGPSGCGKSTLLSLIAGVLEPTQGRVEVLGQDLAGLGRSGRDRFRGENIGYIFQMFNLIPYLSVVDNIELACQLHSKRRARLGQASLRQAVEDLAQALGIHGVLGRPVTELSVGQQQRVAVARALLGAPPLLIADEPTSALDTAHREQFLSLLLAQADRADSTVLFVSHDESLGPLFTRQVRLPELNRV